MCVGSLVSAVCISPAFSLRELLATDLLMACVFSGSLCAQRLFVLDPAWSPTSREATEDHSFSWRAACAQTCGTQRRKARNRLRVRCAFSSCSQCFGGGCDWATPLIPAVCCSSFKDTVWRGGMKRAVNVPPPLPVSQKPSGVDVEVFLGLARLSQP